MSEFKRCKKCVMTNQRIGIQFNDEGICFPCLEFERQKSIDWNGRWQELVELCDFYRGCNGDYYDCIIAVSPGKDSYYQVYLFKEIMNMNPLGIMIDNLDWTETGRLNFNNLSERFDLDIITFTSNRKKMIEMTRKGFLENCHPNKYWDSILYNKPLELAQKLGVKLVIWGEDVSLTTGNEYTEETSNALRLVEDKDKYRDLDVIFTSYYVPWSRWENIKIAKKYGFKGLDDTQEWKRWGMEVFESEQVDTISYLINAYTKFIKFGFSTITEICSDAIRHGKMTREEALILVNEDDWKLDYKMEKSFRKCIGITAEEFWEVIDKHVNKELLEKKYYFHRGWKIRGNWWRLKKNAV